MKPSLWYLRFALLLAAILPLAAVSAFAACTSPTGNAGDIIYNADYHTMQFCDGTLWKSMWWPNSLTSNCQTLPYTATSAWLTPGYGSPLSVWSDGTYFYVGDSNGYITALTFNTSTHVWTSVASSQVAGAGINYVTGNGSYIFAGGGSNMLKALSFNGTAFTVLASDSVAATVSSLYYSGGYLYVSDQNSAALYAVSFNGSAFTNVATFNIPSGGNAMSITGDGTYLYLTTLYGTAYILTFNGSSFTQKYSFTGYQPFFSDGTYVYYGSGSANADVLTAATFNGTSLSTIASFNFIEQAGYTAFYAPAKGKLYIGSVMGVYYLKFNGSTFSYGASWTGGTYSGRNNIFSDGSFIYMADGLDKVQAFPVCN